MYSSGSLYCTELFWEYDKRSFAVFYAVGDFVFVLSGECYLQYNVSVVKIFFIKYRCDCSFVCIVLLCV